MSLTINSNSMALNAQRNLVRSNNALATVFKRLSSGMRVNSAKDDAAGLSVSTRMEAQIREHNQAIRNVNDGISMAQVAEGGMQEAMNTLQRMRELAVQASNDTYSSSDRANLETELDQLKAQLNSIASDTEFNGQKLLDGSLTGKKIQIGESESISLDISQSVASTYKITVGEADTMVELSFEDNANDDSGKDYHGTEVGSLGYSSGAVGNAVDFSGGYITVDDNDDISFGTGVNYSVSSWINLSAQVPNGSSITAFFKGISGSGADYGIELFNSGNEYIYMNSDSRIIQNHPSNSWMHIVGQRSNDGLEMYIDGELVSFDSSGEAKRFDGTDPLIIGAHDPSLPARNFTGSIDELYIFDRSLSQNEITALSVGSLNRASIATRTEAERTISAVDAFINNVADVRSEIGAFQNRLESIQNNLMNAMENTSQARSRIMDADIAQETANLTTASIIQQAGVAILAQANQQPQIALHLLG